MRVLAGRIERVVIVDIVIDGDRRARLDGVRGEPVVDDVQFGDVRGAGKARIGRRFVADLPVEDQVARHIVVQERRAILQRAGGSGHGRQFLIVDLDRLGGKARQRLALGDDDGDRFADMTHPGRGHRVPRADIHRVAVLGADGPAGDDVADGISLQFGAGVNGDHAIHRKGRARIDALDLGMGMRAAHERAVGLVFQTDVVCVFAPARDEPLVLLALDRSADAFAHMLAPPKCLMMPTGWSTAPAHMLAAASLIDRTML